MQPLKKKIGELEKEIEQAKKALKFSDLEQKLAELDDQLNQPEIWNNPDYAQELTKQAASLRQTVEPWQTLTGQVGDMVDLMEQDFAAMLERMYLRWAEKSGMKVDTLERSTNDDAGIKTVVLEISGSFAYGKLRSENGVHRLVRLSPFNADNLRQTSFALVEVLPKIDAPDEISIDPNDLRIDVYRSGGKGGQGVNTTDSAVRVTHEPTGITVAIQNERSQIQNKETALKILRSKLLAMKLEQHAETLSDLRAGESANWGSQIRNYVLHPYTLVKDTRTKHENRNAQGVLDGDIDEFIAAYLEQNANSKNI